MTMKRLLLTLAVVMGILTAHADETVYPYLTFETTDIGIVSVPVESLDITISGTTLTAGDKTFVLSNLNKMYFSTSNVSTDVKTFIVTNWNDITAIYDLNGRKVARLQMQKGAYIVKTKSGTYKLVVK